MDWIEKYRHALQQNSKSKNTIESYISDIKEFLDWFKNTYAKDFDGKILEQDVREYRSYLLNIQKAV